MRVLPSVFSTSSASPVSSDSFTCIFPDITTASAQICFPAVSKITSSFTSSSVLICFRLPFLTTSACGAFKRLIFSRVFFARISCTIPITVFPIIIGRNVRFLKEPTIMSRIVMTRNIRLKYVKTFEITISFVVLSVDISALLVSPFSAFCLTSSSVRPVIFIFLLSLFI